MNTIQRKQYKAKKKVTPIKKKVIKVTQNKPKIKKRCCCVK